MKLRKIPSSGKEILILAGNGDSVSLEAIVYSLVPEFGTLIKIKFYKPQVKQYRQESRFSGKVQSKEKKIIGLKAKYLVEGKLNKLKCKLILEERHKGENTQQKQYLSLEIRQFGDITEYSQREKLQIAFVLRQKLQGGVDVKIKQIEPPVVKFQWTLGLLDFEKVEKNLLEALKAYYGTDFRQLPSHTQSLRDEA